MEQYQSTTVEMDNAGFDELKNQILTSKTEKDANTKDIREKVADATEPEKNKRLSSSAKKFVFRKGDNSVELEDDYEVEIMADKKATKLTLRELKERAAGEIAVKNRMHSLAEEKKEFSQLLKSLLNSQKQILWLLSNLFRVRQKNRTASLNMRNTLKNLQNKRRNSVK